MNRIFVSTQNWLDNHTSHCDRGASVPEYALLMALVLVVCIVSVGFLGGGVESLYNSSFNQFPEA